MPWFGRAKKTEILQTIEGWGSGDVNRQHSGTRLSIGGQPFADVSHKQTPAMDGGVLIVVYPGTALPQGEPGSQKRHFRIARENMPSFEVVDDLKIIGS